MAYCIRRPVSRVLSSARRQMDGHSSGTAVADRLTRPTRTAIRKRITCRPYLVLLPVGLALPSLLPGMRCALTAPFHPCLALRPSAVCFCGAIPGVTPGGCYPPPCFRGARTFLDASCEAPRPSGRLTRVEYRPEFVRASPPPEGYSNAHSTAAAACKAVVSKRGTGQSSACTRSGISVQPRMMPSAPRATSLAITSR
jgi:hypothetical protein